MSETKSLIIRLAGMFAGLLCGGLIAVTSTSGVALADVIPGISTQRVATGFVKPVFCTAPAGDFNRLFVVEKGGRIQILKLADGSRSTFLDITPLVATGGEQGLLCLAFHPSYATNRRFFVNYTGVAAGETRIVEYRAMAGAPDQADPASARLILTFSQPQANHNGGWLGFARGGSLFIATGDGGGANDSATGHTAETGNSQDITDNLLGKILRIDVNRDDFPTDPNRNYGIPSTNPFVNKTGDDEIWAYGLRNPWRCSIDRVTNNQYIGDVGQNAREEINFQPGTAGGGRNFGWRLREGTIANPAAGIGGPAPPGAFEPVYDYAHGSGPLEGNSVTGGYVYRGPIAALNDGTSFGTYFFADFVSGRIWSFQVNGSTIRQFTDWTMALRPVVGTITNVSSFGEDAAGNLYLVDYDGELFKIVQTTAPSPMLQTVVKEAILRVLTEPPNFTVTDRRESPSAN